MRLLPTAAIAAISLGPKKVTQVLYLHFHSQLMPYIGRGMAYKTLQRCQNIVPAPLLAAVTNAG
jgi:outer membrane protein W